jgi:hypothetical protein
MSDTPFDSKRRLCPDGSCVGVIGADGRCTVCGRSGDARPDELDDEAEAPLEAAGPGEPGGFDPARRLCDDGSCLGVIGADGRCNVCGQQAA